MENNQTTSIMSQPQSDIHRAIQECDQLQRACKSVTDTLGHPRPKQARAKLCSLLLQQIWAPGALAAWASAQDARAANNTAVNETRGGAAASVEDGKETSDAECAGTLAEAAKSRQALDPRVYEDVLWRKVFYEPLSNAKRRQKTANWSKEEIQLFDKHIQYGMQFYSELISKYCHQENNVNTHTFTSCCSYNSYYETLRMKNRASSNSTSSVNKSNDGKCSTNTERSDNGESMSGGIGINSKAASMLSTLFLHLGDLSRYYCMDLPNRPLLLKHSASVLYYQQALELYPSTTMAHVNLSSVLSRVHDKPLLAVLHGLAALQSDGESMQARVVLKNLLSSRSYHSHDASVMAFNDASASPAADPQQLILALLSPVSAFVGLVDVDDYPLQLHVLCPNLLLRLDAQLKAAVRHPAGGAGSPSAADELTLDCDTVLSASALLVTCHQMCSEQSGVKRTCKLLLLTTLYTLTIALISALELKLKTRHSSAMLSSIKQHIQNMLDIPDYVNTTFSTSESTSSCPTKIATSETGDTSATTKGAEETAAASAKTRAAEDAVLKASTQRASSPKCSRKRNANNRRRRRTRRRKIPAGSGGQDSGSSDEDSQSDSSSVDSSDCSPDNSDSSDCSRSNDEEYSDDSEQFSDDDSSDNQDDDSGPDVIIESEAEATHPGTSLDQYSGLATQQQQLFTEKEAVSSAATAPPLTAPQMLQDFTAADYNIKEDAAVLSTNSAGGASCSPTTFKMETDAHVTETKQQQQGVFCSKTKLTATEMAVKEQEGSLLLSSILVLCRWLKMQLHDCNGTLSELSSTADGDNSTLDQPNTDGGDLSSMFQYLAVLYNMLHLRLDSLLKVDNTELLPNLQDFLSHYNSSGGGGGKYPNARFISMMQHDKFSLPEDEYLKLVTPSVVPDHVRCPKTVHLAYATDLRNLDVHYFEDTTRYPHQPEDCTVYLHPRVLPVMKPDDSVHYRSLTDRRLGRISRLTNEEQTLLRMFRFRKLLLELSEFTDCPLVPNARTGLFAVTSYQTEVNGLYYKKSSGYVDNNEDNARYSAAHRDGESRINIRMMERRRRRERPLRRAWRRLNGSNDKTPLRELTNNDENNSFCSRDKRSYLDDSHGKRSRNRRRRGHGNVNDEAVGFSHSKFDRKDSEARQLGSSHQQNRSAMAEYRTNSYRKSSRSSNHNSPRLSRGAQENSKPADSSGGSPVFNAETESSVNPLPTSRYGCRSNNNSPRSGVPAVPQYYGSQSNANSPRLGKSYAVVVASGAVAASTDAVATEAGALAASSLNGVHSSGTFLDCPELPYRREPRLGSSSNNSASSSRQSSPSASSVRANKMHNNVLQCYGDKFGVIGDRRRNSLQSSLQLYEAEPYQTTHLTEHVQANLENLVPDHNNSDEREDQEEKKRTEEERMKRQQASQQVLAERWLRHEVAKATAVVEQPSGMLPLNPSIKFLVIDGAVLTQQRAQLLSVMRHLQPTVTVVVPVAVLDQLDDQKRSNGAAREASRWLQAQLSGAAGNYNNNRGRGRGRNGNYPARNNNDNGGGAIALLKMQKMNEKERLPGTMYPGKQHKLIWRWFQILECCHYLARREYLPHTLSKATELGALNPSKTKGGGGGTLYSDRSEYCSSGSGGSNPSTPHNKRKNAAAAAAETDVQEHTLATERLLADGSESLVRKSAVVALITGETRDSVAKLPFRLQSLMNSIATEVRYMNELEEHLHRRGKKEQT